MSKKFLFSSAILFFSLRAALSQNIAINTTGAAANASVLLEVGTGAPDTKGILIPRVNLSATNNNSPIGSWVQGLFVYNLVNAGISPNNVVANQFYYCDGTKWVCLSGGTGGNDWALLGNAGTVDGTNFLGTTDNIPFSIKVNAQKSGRIDHLLFNTFFGYKSGNAMSTGTNNVFIGDNSGLISTNAYGLTCIGSGAGQKSNLGATGESEFIGLNAGANNTTGYYNTFLGTDAGSQNTSGTNNVYLGNSSGYYLSTAAATKNTFVGVAAGIGSSGATGSVNTAIGYNSLYSLSSGTNNTALGAYALEFNFAGSNGTAVGEGAMFYANNSNTPFTNYNVALGFEALRGSNTPASNTGNNNTALGYQTLWSNTSGSKNTAAGFGALYSNSSGNNNTAIGDSSLYTNSTASGNTAVGISTLRVNTTGYQNTAVGGGGVLNLNTTGFFNTAIGNGAMRLNTTASNNTAVGIDALYTQAYNGGGSAWSSYNTAVGAYALYLNQPNATTNGIYNTAMGALALYNNTTGYGNTALGLDALYSDTSGYYNTATGLNALLSNTNGYDNTATGASALAFNTTGINNSAHGFISLYNNSTGSSNTGSGYGAIFSNTTGSNNTAYGFKALYKDSTSGNNTAIGSQALLNNTFSAQNTAIGKDALFTQSYINGNAAWNTDNVAVGFQALYSNQPTSNSTGMQNTAVGNLALNSNTTGKNNTALGYNANVSSGTFNNATAIGANSVVGASNSLVLGGTGANAVSVGIGITTPTQRLDVVGGFTHTTYNTQSYPASDAGGGLTIGWNYSSGNAEVNFYNVYNNAGISYMFSQKTGAGTSKDLLSIIGDTRLRLFGNTSGYTDIKSPAAGGNIVLTLPATAGSNGQVLTTDGTGVTTWSNNPFAAGSGNMVLLYNDETDASGTIGTNPVKSYVVNGTFTQVITEAEVGFDNGGTTAGAWNFVIYYNGVAKETSPDMSANANPYKTSGVVKFCGAIANGQTISIEANKKTAGGTWYVKSLRVYGVY